MRPPSSAGRKRRYRIVVFTFMRGLLFTHLRTLVAIYRLKSRFLAGGSLRPVRYGHLVQERSRDDSVCSIARLLGESGRNEPWRAPPAAHPRLAAEKLHGKSVRITH